MPATEYRAWRFAEVRLADPGGDVPTDEPLAPLVTGYAAVFNSPSEEIEEWGFRFTEIVRPGAFTKTLQEADVRALVNHNVDYVLGRTSAGTLKLTQDARGLAIENTPPDTQWARDLMLSMRRGDINQMSFGFRTVKDRFTEDRENQTVLRELLEVELFDVSIVTFPAYPTTSAVVRSILEGAGLDLASMTSSLLRARAGGQPLSCEDGACLRSAIDVLQAVLPSEPVPDHSARAAARRRRLELVGLS